MTLGGCPWCGSYPHHSIGCPVAAGRVNVPAATIADQEQLTEVLDALARIVSVANVCAVEGDDGFIAGYDIPVGPIHGAIPLLARHGITVNIDGTIHRSTEPIHSHPDRSVE